MHAIYAYGFIPTNQIRLKSDLVHFKNISKPSSHLEKANKNVVL